MNTQQLKAKVESCREGLKDKSGKLCHVSENGPVGMSLMDALVETIETLERRVQELEKGARFGVSLNGRNYAA